MTESPNQWLQEAIHKWCIETLNAWLDGCTTEWASKDMKLKTNGQRGDICLAGRALYSAGLVNPEQLAAAQEEDVKTALAAGLPGAPKKASQDK